jgi:hypothetical protein
MRLFEFYGKNTYTTADDFFKTQEEVEKTFNYEAYRAQEDQARYYVQNNMIGNVPVFEKPHKNPDEENWSNQPNENNVESAGYRGLQNVLRRSGHEYDKSVDHEDPHANPILSKEEQDLIKDAQRRLTR